MCPSSRIFLHTLFHHITFIAWPEIIMDGGFVTDVKLQFPGLHRHLTLTLSIFLPWGHLKNKVLLRYAFRVHIRVNVYDYFGVHKSF
jgi:hypothetical protein